MSLSDPSRRGFLRSTALGLGALGLSVGAAHAQTGSGGTPPGPDLPTAPAGRPQPALNGPDPRPAPPGDRVGWAICGLGHFAQNYVLPHVTEGVESRLTGLISGTPEKLAEVGGAYGVPEAARFGYDMAGLAEVDDIDVVYVVTPTGLHAKHTLAGFDAGKHVLCEKPMASSVDECNAMIDAGEKAGKHLMIAYRVRYDNANTRAIEYARNETLGPVRMISGEIAYPDGRQVTWRNDPALNGGGGPLMDLGIYMVQAHRYISGEEPARVSGMTWRPENDPRFPEGVESRVSWQFEFPSGLLATGVNAWDCGGTNRYAVICENGRIELDPATGYEERTMTVNGKPLDVERANQFANELDHMAECVMQDKTPKTPGEEGRQDVHLMKKIYESAREGRTLEVENLRDA